MLLQTQDAGGPAATSGSTRTAPGCRARRLRSRASPTPWLPSCSTGRAPCSATSRSSTNLERSTRRCSSSRRTSGRRGRTSRSTSACVGSTTRHSPVSKAQAASRTTTRRQTHCASRATARRANRSASRSTFSNLNARTGISWRLNDETVRSRRIRREHDSVSGQPLCLQLPGQAELLGHGAPTASRPLARWPTGFPAPTLVNIPQDGIIPVSGSLLNSTYDVIPPGLREGTLHSWNVAVQRQLPFHLTADIAYVGNRGVNLVMDIDENASLVYGLATSAGRSSRSSTGPARRASAATRTSPNTTRCR